MHNLSRIYNLLFRAIMNLTQTFDGVTCDTTVSELDVNRKYRILKAKRLTTRFGSMSR